jgi:sortase A
MIAIIPAWAISNVSNSDPYNFASSSSIPWVEEVNEYADVSKDAALLPPAYNSGYDAVWSRPYVMINSSTGLVDNVTYDFAAIDTNVTRKTQYTTVPAYSDGSIGKLTIPKINVSVKVWEGETLDNLKKGAGHFTGTSQWDGNVGLCGHNRGSYGIFGEIHLLSAGDRITYETSRGTRTYEVYYIGQISEYDWSRLGWTESNIITLTTCVRDVPELRYCVQAREVV